MGNPGEHGPAAMRRAPQRARGQRRVAAILDAAEQLFAEDGYEATTTNEVAARAGVPIGSIYQFFPNKEAILHAVTARYREGMADLYAAVLPAQSADLPLTEQVGRLVAATIDYGAEHFGFTRIVLQAGASPPLTAAAGQLQQEIIAQLERILERCMPSIPAEERALHAMISVHAVTAVIGLGVARKYAGQAELGHRIVLQAATLMIAYLDAVLVGSPAPISPSRC